MWLRLTGLPLLSVRSCPARRHHLLARGVKDRAASTATTALAEHLRHAALSEPSLRNARGDPDGRRPFHDG
ncbi:hypothetical protein ACFXPY_36870 [Streptomyces sp. NPDC059153]|uniref:hypothetical protein n=1 Tax=Streptomyces sp. NPDC059153 TaxID=3346743 RepID=UPI0036CB0B64